MASYAFTAPILKGKTETLKKYAREAMGPRRNEYFDFDRKIGLEVEQIWIQQTPGGDMVVARWETDNPARIMEECMTSEHPFGKWFREKVLFECLGLSPSDEGGPLNELIVDYHGQSVGDKTYSESRKK